MANDTISRQAAIDFIDAGRLVNPNEPRWSDNEVVAFLKSRPSAERRGRWIKKYRGNYLCSVCGAWYRTTDDYGNIIDGEMTANYCESCGAKMEAAE